MLGETTSPKSDSALFQFSLNPTKPYDEHSKSTHFLPYFYGSLAIRSCVGGANRVLHRRDRFNAIYPTVKDHNYGKNSQSK
jgi:hypothetical protein